MKKEKMSRQRIGIRSCMAVILLVCCVGLLSSCGTQGKEMRIQIIHNNPCESCNEEDRLKELVSSLTPDGGSDYELEIYYAYSAKGRSVFLAMLKEFDLEEGSVFFPFLVIGDRYLSGNQQIEEHLTEYMKSRG